MYHLFFNKQKDKNELLIYKQKHFTENLLV